MVVNIHKLIATINPDIYCNWEQRSEVKKELKNLLEKMDSRAYIKASEKAKPIESDYVDVLHTKFSRGAFHLEGLKHPIEKHNLTYDAFSQSLEPIYFWILDEINKSFKSSSKLVDNFVSSAASGHFAEISGRATPILLWSCSSCCS